MTQPHLLLVGDFVKKTGFARVNEALAAGLSALGWRVSVLAVRYAGDPTPLQGPYALYPAEIPGSDYYGMQRLPQIIAVTKPDVILLVNDPWIVDDYLTFMQQIPNLPPVAAYLPVDGAHLNPARQLHLNTLSAAIAYTQFGAQELAKAGLKLPIAIIPHGIDLAQFQPMDQQEARTRLGIPEGFVVLLCDSNSGRKRLDLAIDAFARFVQRGHRAHLLIHSEMNSPWGWDLGWLCAKHGIFDQAIFTGKHGKLPDEALRLVYAAADVRLSATMGEGWGLTIMEAMACGLPVVAPHYSALAEWADEAALLVDCDPELSHTYIGSAHHEGGIARPEVLADALSILYRDPAVYGYWQEKGAQRVQEPCYQWGVINAQFDAILREAIQRAAGVPLGLSVRPGTIDRWVVDQVVTHNEYQVGELRPDDLVIDIGAHIGAFSILAYTKGSRQIEAYEPDQANAEQLRKNIDHAASPTSVALMNVAVGRSDGPAQRVVLFTGHNGKNTGSGNTVYGDGEQRPVDSYALDSIIGTRRVALLKIDAESAEWPILLTCTRLSQVAQIVGEYHEVGGPHDTNVMTDELRVGNAERYVADDLRAFLEVQGFDVGFTPYALTSTGEPSNMGRFIARRRDIHVLERVEAVAYA